MDTKKCLYCDKELTRKEQEYPSNYERRIYCDRFCASQHRGSLAKIHKKTRKSSDSPWFYNAA